MREQVAMDSYRNGGELLPGIVSKLKGGAKVSATLLGVCLSVAGFCFIVWVREQSPFFPVI